MSRISPIALSHYNLTDNICEAERITQPSISTRESLFMLASLSQARTVSLTPKNALLDRQRSALSANHHRVDALNQNLIAAATNPMNLLLAFSAPALIARSRPWFNAAELSLSSIPAQMSVARAGAALSGGLLAACAGAAEGEDYVTADASLPPPSQDLTCENVYDRINETQLDAEWAAVIESIEFPELDVTHDGNNGIAVIANSKGDLVSRLNPSDPVAWVQVGDKLFILTANKIPDGFNPATLWVYPLNEDNTLASDQPLPTRQFNGNAILLAQSFGPSNMALVKIEGSEWLGLTLGAASGNKSLLIDPAGPFNPTYDPQIVPDYCATQDYTEADAGSSEVDAAAE